mgnify:CR=1 FL=1
MKRRGPRTKWQRIIRETIFEVLIGAAIGLAFDAVAVFACADSLISIVFSPSGRVIMLLSNTGT